MKRTLMALILLGGFAAPGMASPTSGESWAADATAGLELAIRAAKAKGAAAKSAAAAGMAASFRLDASGMLQSHLETRLVYGGQIMKCYNIRYVSSEYTGDGTRYYIMVLVNDVHIETLKRPGESMDVCGTKILLKGWEANASNKAYWEASEIRR